MKRRKVKPFPKTFRRWKNIDFQSLRRDLHDALPWTPGSCVSNREEGWQCWAQAVIPIFDRYAPFVTVPLKHESGFGISAATRHLIRLTTAQLRISRRTNAETLPSIRICAVRLKRPFVWSGEWNLSQVSNHIGLAKILTWNLINTTPGKVKVALPLDKDTARSFNVFFLFGRWKPRLQSAQHYMYKWSSFGLPRVLSTKFDHRPATLAELRTVIRSLKSHTSCGPDGLHAFFKSFSSRLLGSLLRVFNSSIISGTLPSCWK